MPQPTKILNVIDLEATCWANSDERPEGELQEIIEIGLCEVNMVNKEIVGKYSYLVTPTMSKVSDFCTNLTTITQDMLDKEGIPFEEACSILRSEHNSKGRIWASWGDWDRTRFFQDCQNKDVSYPFPKSHLNIKTLHGMARGFTMARSLGKACKHEGIEFEGTSHRGVDDAYNMSKVLLGIFEKGD